MSNGNTGLDGLMNTERDELLERVAYLEKRTSDQVEELTCLKSALADCLRRVQLLESSRGTHSPTRRIAPRTSSESRVSRAATATGGSRQMIFGGGEGGRHLPRLPSNINAGTPISRRPPSQASLRSGNPTSPSSIATAPPGFKGSSGNIGRPPTSNSKSGTREPTYLRDEGILKMYLRGRCLNLYAPTDIATDYTFSATLPEPEEQLKLEWVYGYRGKDCRNNVYLLPTGEIIYFVAAVAVLYNLEQHSQRHYLEHNDAIKCLAIHPDRITIATGQSAGHGTSDARPHIRIWNSVSLETLHVIGLGIFENSVACLSFSKTDGGSMIAVIDEAANHTITIWDWQKSRRIAETKTSGDPVIAVDFNPIDANSLVTIGKSHLAFWTMENNSLNKKLGVFDKYEKPKFVLSMVFAENGDLITGDSNGNIFLWTRGSNRIGHAVLGVHVGGIFALTFSKDGHLLSGGGKDCRIVQLDTNLDPTGMAVELSSWYGPVRTLISGPGEMIIVGTTQGDILQGRLGEDFCPLVQGHSDKFWALSAHPQSHHFLTAGRDGNIFLWDSLTRRLVWAENLSEELTCAAFYPPITPSSPTTNQNGRNGNDLADSVPVVAVGTGSGRWIVLDALLHQVIAAHHETNEAIQCIAYSPNGQYIAIGGRDNSIYVYSVSARGTKYVRLGKCSGHSSFVLHLDWSEDSQCIRSVSGDYELLFWSASNCKQITSPSNMRDVRWVTQSCHLGFEVAGIWPPDSDGTDINAVCRSHSTRLLASADDFSQVNLFRYPTCQLKSNSRSYRGHSSHVTNVSFLFDDSRIISAGGADTAILQWEVIS
nr:echinoderm microtubule associated protein1 [Hymenolepis microstoma]